MQPRPSMSTNMTRTLSTYLCIACLSIGVSVLAGCGGGNNSADSGGQSILADLIPGMDTPSPGEAARDAFNVYDADKRRRAVVLLSNASWGGEPPYLRTYRLLINDRDSTVRAAAISALGRWGDPTDVPSLTKRLNEEEESADLVRWEAAKALQRIHSDEAIGPMSAALAGDPDADVRQACATALGQYPSRRAFDTLVGALDDSDFGVVTAAAEALQTLTGKDFSDDGQQWWQWAKDNPNLFEGKQTYYYPQFYAKPSLIGRMAVWKDHTPPTPQEPRTEIAAATTGPTALTGGAGATPRPREGDRSLYDFQVPATLPDGNTPAPRPDLTPPPPTPRPAPAPSPPPATRPQTAPPPPPPPTTSAGSSRISPAYDADDQPPTGADSATTVVEQPTDSTDTAGSTESDTSGESASTDSTATSDSADDTGTSQATDSADTTAGDTSDADADTDDSQEEARPPSWHIFGAGDGR